MRIAMLVSIPEKVDMRSYLKGFINAIISIYPAPIKEVVVLESIPKELRDKADGLTFRDHDGSTYVSADCGHDGCDRKEMEVKALELIMISGSSSSAPAYGGDGHVLFNGKRAKGGVD